MLLLMAMTLVVMACTGVEDMAGTPEQERSAQQLPVAFSAYVNRSTTRGGATGQLTTDGTGGTTSLRKNLFILISLIIVVILFPVFHERLVCFDHIS